MFTTTIVIHAIHIDLCYILSVGACWATTHDVANIYVYHTVIYRSIVYLGQLQCSIRDFVRPSL